MINNKIYILWEKVQLSFWWKIDNLNVLKNKWFNVPKGFFFNNSRISEIAINSLFLSYIKSDKYIVRSSASCEDSKKISYAWMFKSISWFYKKGTLLRDVLSVFNSINSDYLNIYEKEVLWSSQKNRRMNVLIQEYISWDISWVYLSNINKNRIIWFIRWWNQLLVDWKVSWTEIYMNRKFKIIKENYNVQSSFLNRELSIINYNKKVYLINSLFEDLIKVFKRIEKIFGFDIDIEWTIKDNQIYILQARPITI